jgi:hypothetical protein
MHASKLTSSLFAIALAIPTVARADTDAPSTLPKVSVDLDLALFASKGHSFFVGLAPAPHLKVLIGTVSGDLPSFTQPSAWHQRAQDGDGLLVQYAAHADGSGPFIGAVALWMHYRFSRDTMLGVEVARDQLVLGIDLGYTWFPFAAQGFYVQPFVGVGANLFEHGDVVIDGDTYKDKVPVAILPALFVGWQWGR